MYENLKFAAWTNKGATIGGGVFSPAECREAARKLEAFGDMLTALEQAVSDTDMAECHGNGADCLFPWRVNAKAAIAKARGE